MTGTDADDRPGLRARVAPARRSRRRAAHWKGQWRLDANTRRIGLAGVASARAALARAMPDQANRADPGDDHRHLRRAS
jgi:hypothetical protein